MGLEANEECSLAEDTQKDKYLTFRLAEEDYGIEIGDVIEIIGIQKITQLPDMPRFIKGVINLRGQVIPVMDVRLRFGLPARDYDERTCIVVVKIEEKTVGLVVDRVNEVVDIPESQVELPNSSTMALPEQNVKGLGKIREEIRILLDTEKILAF